MVDLCTTASTRHRSLHRPHRPDRGLCRRTAAPSRCTRVSCTGCTASFFFLALFSGFGIYLPWIFRWFTPLFGGGAMTPLTASLVRSGIRLLLRSADAELAAA